MKSALLFLCIKFSLSSPGAKVLREFRPLMGWILSVRYGVDGTCARMGPTGLEGSARSSPFCLAVGDEVWDINTASLI
jgi:hypothetical protein